MEFLMFRRVFQHLYSWYMGLLAQWRFRPFKNWSIKRLIRVYGVDLSCVAEPDIEKYSNFNEFFTRALKPESRPIAENSAAIVSPADGFISQIGDFKTGKIIQAKTVYYSVDQLLGCNAKHYNLDIGCFVNIYLSPSDYHRVHIPMTGVLKKMTYIPGDLFSVSPGHVGSIPNLFVRNERVVTLFETEIGYMALVLVGAISVGKIEMVWEKKLGAWDVKNWDYSHQNNVFTKGQEVGRFLIGSTVIALFPSNKVVWDSAFCAGDAVKMGQALGQVVY